MVKQSLPDAYFCDCFSTIPTDSWRFKTLDAQQNTEIFPNLELAADLNMGTRDTSPSRSPISSITTSRKIAHVSLRELAESQFRITQLYEEPGKLWILDCAAHRDNPPNAASFASGLPRK